MSNTQFLKVLSTAEAAGKLNESTSSKRRCWVHPLNSDREKNNTRFQNFMKIYTIAKKGFSIIIEYPHKSFDELVNLAKFRSHLTKEVTNIRNSLNAEVRLTVTIGRVEKCIIYLKLIKILKYYKLYF